MTPNPPIHLKTPLNNANRPLTILSVSPMIWPSFIPATFYMISLLIHQTTAPLLQKSVVTSFAVLNNRRRGINIPYITGENFFRRRSQRVTLWPFAINCVSWIHLLPQLIHWQLKSICSTSVLPSITLVNKLFLQSCSKSTQSQTRTLQSMVLIDGPKLLGNGGNYLIIQTTLLLQLENHT